MQETIEAVRRAEQEAEALEKATRQDCKRIVAEAKEKAAAMHEEKLREARQAAEADQQAAREKSKTFTEQAEQSAQGEVQKLEQEAALKKEEAIRQLLATLL